MKIQILNNTKYDITKEKKGLIDYFKRNSVDFTTSERAVSVPTPTVIEKTVLGFNAKTGKPQMVKYIKLTDSIRDELMPFIEDVDIVFFVRGIEDKKPDEVFTNWTDSRPIKNNTIFIQLIVNDYLQDTGNLLLAMLHETMHALCFIYGAKDEMDAVHKGVKRYNNDQPDNPDSNFGFTWKNLKPFLNKTGTETLVMKIARLRAMFKQEEAPQIKYKNFTESEVKGLKHEFVLLLDKARDIAGIPFVINSGFRTPAHNKKVGGVANSAHLTGLAVDLRARTGAETYAIIKSAMEVGIKRIGINRASQFVHLDISYSDKPYPTIYEY